MFEWLKQLLGNKQTNNAPKNRMTHSQADDQGELGDLIGQGVKHFTHSGDHVKSPGDLSIHSIRQENGMIIVEASSNVRAYDGLKTHSPTSTKTVDGKILSYFQLSELPVGELFFRTDTHERAYTIREAKAEVLLTEADFDAVWDSDCKSVGIHQIRITFKGDYAGSAEKNQEQSCFNW